MKLFRNMKEEPSESMQQNPSRKGDTQVVVKGKEARGSEKLVSRDTQRNLHKLSQGNLHLLHLVSRNLIAFGQVPLLFAKSVNTRNRLNC